MPAEPRLKSCLKRYESCKEIFTVTVANGVDYRFEIRKEEIFCNGRPVGIRPENAESVWETAKTYDGRVDCYMITACGECDRYTGEVERKLLKELNTLVPQ